MVQLIWDALDDRLVETGVEKGVLFVEGAIKGVAWNGLTGVTETPSGAETTDLYADNQKYGGLQSAEKFGGTIEAYTFPDEWMECDGSVEVVPGLVVGQQPRKSFDMAYRTNIENVAGGAGSGYKIHLAYGCKAAPSERPYKTVNDSPEAMTFSWTFTTTPIALDGHKPTALLTINSTKVTPTALTALEKIIYGAAATEPRMPTPNEVVTLIGTP